MRERGTSAIETVISMAVMLVIAASDLSEEACDVVSTAIEMVLRDNGGRGRPRLLGVVLAQTQNRFESVGRGSRS